MGSDPAQHVITQAQQLFEAGRLAAAVALLADARLQQPEDGPLAALLGALLVESKDFEGAAPILADAMELLPDDPAPALNLGLALHGLDPDGSRAAFAEACARAPGDGAIHRRAGFAALERDEPPLCLRLLERAAALSADLPDSENDGLNGLGAARLTLSMRYPATFWPMAERHSR